LSPLASPCAYSAVLAARSAAPMNSGSLMNGLLGDIPPKKRANDLAADKGL
jgi:hypothetical protein